MEEGVKGRENAGKKGKGEGIQNPLIYLKGERKVSSVSFLKVVDFYVFWQDVWNKISRKCQTMNNFKCTTFLALIKLTINVQLFMDRWNVSKSLKLCLKWNFQCKLIVLIINKQCLWMKFIAHVVGCMHEIRWLMKYIYGSNWSHKCNCSTSERNYMDQLWWHQPNWIFKVTLITRVKKNIWMKLMTHEFTIMNLPTIWTHTWMKNECHAWKS